MCRGSGRCGVGSGGCPGCSSMRCSGRSAATPTARARSQARRRTRRAGRSPRAAGRRACASDPARSLPVRSPLGRDLRRQLPDQDRREHDHRCQHPGAERDPERRDPGGGDERERDNTKRRAAQPARVQHDERAEREDQRQRGDLLDGGDQLVAVDERRQRDRQRRQGGEPAVEPEPAHEHPRRAGGQSASMNALNGWKAQIRGTRTSNALPPNKVSAPDG